MSAQTVIQVLLQLVLETWLVGNFVSMHLTLNWLILYHIRTAERFVVQLYYQHCLTASKNVIFLLQGISTKPVGFV